MSKSKTAPGQRYNEAAEIALLASWINEPGYVTPIIQADVSGEDLSPKSKNIFDGFCRIVEAHGPAALADQQLVTALLTNVDQVLLHTVYESTMTTCAANVEATITIIRQCAKRRRLMEITVVLQMALAKGEDVSALIAKQCECLDAYNNDATTNEPITLAEWMQTPEFTAPMQRLSTGYSDLDDALGGGLVPGALIVLAGGTGSGKSTFSLNIARRMSLAGNGVLIVTLEDSPLIVTRRILSAEARIPYGRLEGWRLSETEAQTVSGKIAASKNTPLSIQRIAALSAITAAIAAHGRNGGKLVVVDQASHVHVPDAKDAYARVSAVSRSLQAAAASAGVVVLLVAQLNRNGANREGKPQITDLRDSGNLENDSRGVLLLQRNEDVLECEVGKNSYGPAGRTAKFTAVLEESRIETYCPEHPKS